MSDIELSALTYFFICRDRYEQVLKTMKFETLYMSFPMIVDGVLDSVRYNIKEKRFDKMTLTLCDDKKPVMHELFENAVYCDKIKLHTIDIPEKIPDEILDDVNSGIERDKLIRRDRI